MFRVSGFGVLGIGFGDFGFRVLVFWGFGGLG